MKVGQPLNKGLSLKFQPADHIAREEPYNLIMATASYLDRLLEPLTEAFTPQLASTLIALRADAEMEARIVELREKTNAGTLTPEEDAEYKDFVEAVDLISIMQGSRPRTNCLIPHVTRNSRNMRPAPAKSSSQERSQKTTSVSADTGFGAILANHQASCPSSPKGKPAAGYFFPTLTAMEEPLVPLT